MLSVDGYAVYEMDIKNISGNQFKVILSDELILDYKDGKFQMHFTSREKTSLSAGRSLRYVEVEEVKKILEEEMEHAADLRVPLEIDMHTGTNWYEAK